MNVAAETDNFEVDEENHHDSQPIDSVDRFDWSIRLCKFEVDFARKLLKPWLTRTRSGTGRIDLSQDDMRFLLDFQEHERSGSHWNRYRKTSSLHSAKVICIPVSSSFEKVRNIPELMLQIYSFLSLRARMYTLACVDHKCHRDSLRKGSVLPHYRRTPEYYSRLDSLLCELEQWAMERIKKHALGQDFSGKPISRTQNLWAIEVQRHHSRISNIKAMKQRAERLYRIDCAAYFHPKLNGNRHWLHDLIAFQTSFAHAINYDQDADRLLRWSREMGFDEDIHLYVKE